jgi:Spy/CpxP family protein refolding chaperone
MGKNNVRMAMFLAIVLLGSSAQSLYAAAVAPQCQQEETSAKNWDSKRQQFYSDLGLSDEQKKLLDENRKKQREQNKQIFSQVKEKTALLRQELQEEPLNTEKIYQTNNELKKLQEQISDNRVERILEVRKILTADQFKKFIAKTEKQKEHSRYKRGAQKEGL